MPAPPPSQPAIQIRDFSKRYGRILALKDLNLEVQRGEIFGFLGLNGAGKTTAIRLLLGLLKPDRGHASIFGFDCQKRGCEARAHTGYLPGELGFYGDMSGRQLLDLFAGLHCRALDLAYQRELLDRLGFPDQDLRRKLREYSTGMKRKLGLVQALQADPPLVILDEPTEGLDPLVQDALNRLLADLRKRGRTIFFSSHVLAEVERICDRVALIRRGELVLCSTIGEIRSMAPRTIKVNFSAPVEMPSAGFPDGFSLVASAPHFWELKAKGTLGQLIGLLSGLPVADMQVEEPGLEEILIRFYREGV